LPKIITHKWKLGDLLEAPNLLPMKDLFVTIFESNEGKRTSVQLQINFQLQKVTQFWWLFSPWCFTQFGVLLSPIALKVVGPLLFDSNSSMDDTNPLFKFPIWQLTNKETKRQAITKDQKMKRKVNQYSFNKTNFQGLFNN